MLAKFNMFEKCKKKMINLCVASYTCGCTDHELLVGIMYIIIIT